MRTSAFLAVPAFAAIALAQTGSGSNPALSYITQTDSRGVPTGQPAPVTTQPSAVVTQPGVVTTQPTVATVPATGGGSTLVVVPSGATGGTGVKNGTVSTGKPSGSSSSNPSSTAGSGSTATSSGSTSGSSTGSSDAGILEPMLGLGFAGVLFAAFL